MTKQEAKDKAAQAYNFRDWNALVWLGYESKMSAICDLAMEIYLKGNTKPAPEGQQ